MNRREVTVIRGHHDGLQQVNIKEHHSIAPDGCLLHITSFHAQKAQQWTPLIDAVQTGGIR